MPMLGGLSFILIILYCWARFSQGILRIFDSTLGYPGEGPRTPRSSAHRREYQRSVSPSATALHSRRGRSPAGLSSSTLLRPRASSAPRFSVKSVDLDQPSSKFIEWATLRMGSPESDSGTFSI
jgi:hypothetical protein